MSALLLISQFANCKIFKTPPLNSTSTSMALLFYHRHRTTTVTTLHRPSTLLKIPITIHPPHLTLHYITLPTPTQPKTKKKTVFSVTVLVQHEPKRWKLSEIYISYGFLRFCSFFFPFSFNGVWSCCSFAYGVFAREPGSSIFVQNLRFGRWPVFGSDYFLELQRC